MGKISDENDKVFRVSLEGEDGNSSEPEKYAVHSGFDYPKIEEDMVGVVNFTVPNPMSVGIYEIATINHNLGYKPMTQCFLEDVDGTFFTEFAILPFFGDVGFMSSNIFRCYATTTQVKIVLDVTFDFGSRLPGTEYNFKYQIWVND